jgi:hypothetical protein
MSNLEEKIDNLTLSTSSSDADTTSSEDGSSEEGTVGSTEFRTPICMSLKKTI